MHVLTPIWTLATYIGPFLFVLCVVVFFHEFGHFIVGRLCGVKVDAFSIGFGPEVFAFVDRKGTRWRLGAFPLGGYVKFFGDANGASVADAAALDRMDRETRAVTLSGQPVWKRAAIVLAGPIANFILAIAILTGLGWSEGRAVLRPIVASVIKGEPADAAGFKAGDLVISIDGRAIGGWQDLQDKVQDSAGVPLTVVVQRAGADVTLVATPEVRAIHTIFGESRTPLLGLNGSNNPADVRIVYCGVGSCLASATRDTWTTAARTVEFIGQVFSGRQSADQISGPVGIAKISGEVARFGMGALLNLIAVLSISIGLINLAPVPLLDGGHLLYYAVEAIMGRPMSERLQEYGFRVGLGLVLALMIFATVNDIMHFTRG